MKENEKQPTGAGKSSFDLIDADKLFHGLNLQKGISFLDVEFKKIDGHQGPPIHIRLSPENVADRVDPYGFKKERSVDTGPYN